MTNYARKIKLSNRTVYIIDDEDIVLQSYNAFVARIRNGRLILGPLWHYSPTTWKHVRQFIEDYLESLVEWTDDDECVYSAAHGWMVKLFAAKNGRKYMQTLVDNGIIPVEDDWTLYDCMINDD